jgi:membrane-bound lytic murein transglycosylase D
MDTPESFETQLATLPPPDRFITVQKRYKVKRGDTIYRVASRFNTTPAALKRLNGRIVSKKGKIVAGQVLVVSRERTRVSGEVASNDHEQLVNPAVEQAIEPPTEKQIAKAEKSEKNTADDNASDRDEVSTTKQSRKKASKNIAKYSKDDDNGTRQVFHKVRAGESLFAIAKKYDVSIKDLAAWNDLRIKDGVQTGKKLVISENDNQEKATRTAKADKSKGKSKDKLTDDNRKEKRLASKEKGSKKSAQKDDVKRISYEVKRGDTLYSISQRYNISVSQIKTWNKAAKNIKPGQDLVLYLARS